MKKTFFLLLGIRGGGWEISLNSYLILLSSSVCRSALQELQSSMRDPSLIKKLWKKTKNWILFTCCVLLVGFSGFCSRSWPWACLLHFGSSQILFLRSGHWKREKYYEILEYCENSQSDCYCLINVYKMTALKTIMTWYL